MSNDEIFAAEGLSVVFSSGDREVRAVDGVSFRLRRGMTLALVGESGSGKSVTALALMRLLPSTARIAAPAMLLYDESGAATDILSCTPRQMRSLRGNRMAMIFQEPMSSLNPVMRCGHQVTEVLRVHCRSTAAAARARTLELFSEVRFDDPEGIFSAYPHEISGGQKQRVMIAMAIAANPSLLIADEPTTALDATVRREIILLLKDLQQKYRMAMLFITHDLGLVAGVADEVAVMRRGRIVEMGPVKQVMTEPRHPYTRVLLACRPMPGQYLERLPVPGDFEGIGPEISTGEVSSRLQRDPVAYMKKLDTIYSNEPLLRAENITVTFPGRGKRKKTPFRALDRITLDVYPGEVLGVVGESGCGKTTLGRTILRLRDATSGRVLYEGSPIGDRSARGLKKLRKDLQIVFQDPMASLNPLKTAGETLTEPMKVHRIGTGARERKALALELLEKTGLGPEIFGRYPHELSGGQRQRLCIARALAVKPRFIVCDESVSALDMPVQAQVLNLLIDLKKEFGLTYVFISHDLAVINFISDRVVVMKEGKIIETGTPEKILRSPENPYTRMLTEAAG